MIKRLLQTLFCLCVLGSVQAHEGHGAAATATTAIPKPELGAAAVFAENGTLWVVSKEGAGTDAYVVLQRSTDLGKTWSAPQRVNVIPEAIAASGDSFPKVAIGTRGEVYVSWMHPLAKLYTGDVRFARSLDGGNVFSEPVTVNTDRQQITHSFDSLTVDKNGHIFLAWIDKRDQEAAKKTNTAYRGAAVYAAVSTDAGASFAPEFKLAEHSCECCRIATAPDAQGGAWVFWRHVFEPNVRDHALLHINANGTPEAMQRATIDNWKIDACPHHGPAIAQDDAGTLHAVWFTLGEQPGVKYGRLSVAAKPMGVRNIGTESAAHADLAVAEQNIAIAWTEFDGKATRLQLMRSADRGVNWTQSTLMRTVEATGQPRVLSWQGRLFVFWNTASQARLLFVLP